jgi:hypothetical protein
MDWRWGSDEHDAGRELVMMALDTRLVIDELRRASMEAEIWNAGETGQPPVTTPEQFMADDVRPHFAKMLGRLGDFQNGSRDVVLATERLERALWKHPLPADFFGEELQGVYRDTWFATGHLVCASGVCLDGLSSAERSSLASAAACVLLDPTVDRVFGSGAPDPQSAMRILNQALSRERGGAGRDR